MSGWEKFLDKLGFEIVDEDEDELGTEQTVVQSADDNGKKTKKTKEERRQEIVRPALNNGKGDLFVVEPTKRGDAKIVCDELRDGKTVVVYVETMDQEETTRLYDFIQGSVYALDARIKQISDNVIVVAPNGIDIQTSEMETEEGYSSYSYIDDDIDYNY